jgi:hypothetical protein
VSPIVRFAKLPKVEARPEQRAIHPAAELLQPCVERLVIAF